MAGETAIVADVRPPCDELVGRCYAWMVDGVLFSQQLINHLDVIFSVQHHQGSPLMCGRDDPSLILL